MKKARFWCAFHFGVRKKISDFCLIDMNFTVMVKKNHSIFSSLQLCTALMQLYVAQHHFDGSIWEIPSQQESLIGKVHKSSRKFVSSGHRESFWMCKWSPFIDDTTEYKIKIFFGHFQAISVKVFSHFSEAYLSQKTTKKKARCHCEMSICVVQKRRKRVMTID